MFSGSPFLESLGEAFGDLWMPVPPSCSWTLPWKPSTLCSNWRPLCSRRTRALSLPESSDPKCRFKVPRLGGAHVCCPRPEALQLQEIPFAPSCSQLAFEPPVQGLRWGGWTVAESSYTMNHVEFSTKQAEGETSYKAGNSSVCARCPCTSHPRNPVTQPFPAQAPLLARP